MAIDVPPQKGLLFQPITPALAAATISKMPLKPPLPPTRGSQECNTTARNRTLAQREICIAAMTEAFDAACEKLGDSGQHEVPREVIAGQIIAAARLGECDPARLLEAALRKRD
jgi:hypothetical protein